MPTAPFVGRQAELHFLDEQFRLACHTGSRLVLVAAEAGAGKTTLVRHFFAGLGNRGAGAVGRGWDNQAAVSYHALREVLLQAPLAHKPANPPLDSFLQDSPGSCAELTPPVLFPALAGLFEAQAQQRPLCLFLDDLQWADEGTFEWLDFVLTRPAAAPILWLGAYRSEESASLAPLLDRRSRWYRAEGLAELTLSPLSRGAVEELAHLMVNEAQWREELPERVWRRSEGLALLAVEEIRAFVEGREETAVGQALIASRLNRLSPEDRELLSLAAVVGERFAVEPLAGLLGQKALEVARRLERLRQEQTLVVENGTGYRFGHSRFREALLAGMSQSLRQRYHDRLSQDGHLPAAERAYHLVHGGDQAEGIQVLLAEGDRALHWRDQLRYYLEALALAQQGTGVADRLRLSVYQRIGDLHLDLGKHALARPYYETARHWARTTREQVLLLCRLARTCRGHSPQQRRCWEEAIRLLPAASDPVLADWVRFHRALNLSFTSDAEDLHRLYQLGGRLRPMPDLPQIITTDAHGLLIDMAVRLGKTQDLQGFLVEKVGELSPESYALARYHGALARGAAREHRWEEYFCHLREARRLYQALGNEVEFQVSCENELHTLLAELGMYPQVREFLRELDPQGMLALLYRFNCATWIADRPAAGLDWARRYLDGVEVFFLEYPTDGGHLRTLFCGLGEAERIFRDLGRSEEFAQRLAALRASLGAAGYHTEGVWSLNEPVELPELAAGGPSREWAWRPGVEGQAELLDEGDTLVLRRLNSTGDYPSDAPRLSRRVAGDFALQATLHSGNEVVESILGCCQERQAGSRAALGRTGGGLFVGGPDRHHYLRLSMHIHTPGEVVFEARMGGPYRFLGRGLLPDSPIRLRLEKQGPTFAAYAGAEGEEWYPCGTIELPGWEECEVGLCVNLTSPLGTYLVETIEAGFSQIRLQGTPPAPIPAEAPASLYPLPVPTLAPDLPELVAASQDLQRLLQRVRQAADLALPVLVQGETGTGKELIARALHRLGNRSQGPFIPLNCAAIPPDLIERELFGHVRGAYTGAYESRGGLFEAADQGILFLDEIDQASPQFQTRLLRVVEEQAVRRVGGQQLRQVDVRLVAAANRDLAQAVDQGHFRHDLYYRLKGLEFHLPPLRQRREEIPHLVAYFLHQWAQERGRPLPGVTQWAMATLMDYDWPGNVRELLHAIAQAAEAAQAGVITSAVLGLWPPRPLNAEPDERQRLTEAMRATGGNVSEAARRLGISRNTIYRRMRKLGLRSG